MNIQKTVYLVRHGQSEQNTKPVFQGIDSPLSDQGRQQAQQIARRVSKLEFETLISSPYERAKETAEIIGKVTGKSPEFSDLFVERKKPSSVSGRPHSDEKASATYKEWDKTMYTQGSRIEDGENFDDLNERAEKSLSFLASRPESTLVVVTHGNFLRTILTRILLGDALSGEAVRNIRKALSSAENTSISVLHYRDDFEEDFDWHLWIYNDHAHLG